MGTNYYLKTKEILNDRFARVLNINRPVIDESHIGKSSCGWCFAVHVIPNSKFNTWNNWKKYIRKNKKLVIYDEYNRILTFKELINIVENRHSNTTRPDAFLHFNHATIGPNNMLRHELGLNCISHGSGTWDHLVGEFS